MQEYFVTKPLLFVENTVYSTVDFALFVVIH